MLKVALRFGALFWVASASSALYAQESPSEEVGAEQVDEVEIDGAPADEAPTPEGEAEGERPGKPAGARGAERASERVMTLREAETRSRRLKEDIFRSKATLKLLEELLVESASLGSGVRITHINDITRGYEVEAIQYHLNGRPLLLWEKSDGEAVPSELELRSEALPPGEHVLQVSMTLRGRGGGFFRYVEAMTFDLQSMHTFRVRPGQVSALRVQATTRPKGRLSYEQRPRLVYDQPAVAEVGEG